MRVAIIGAGISGLSCARELERLGVRPVIFEKKHKTGNFINCTCIWFRQFQRQYSDPLSYLREKYLLEIQPLSRLREAVMIAPGASKTVRGNLGYIFKRGMEDYSVENQIAALVKSPVIFNFPMSALDIKDDFDYVVDATGTSATARMLGIWKETLVAQVRIATLLGNFEPDAAQVWFNTDYAKNLLAYLIPANLREAFLVLAVNGITHQELEHYWDTFLGAENIRYAMTETQDIEYRCGSSYPFRKDNILLVGNAAGFTDDVIGTGVFNAIESGIIAARSIVRNADYTRMVTPIYKNLIKLHEIRRMLNTFDNDDYRRFVLFLGMPGVRHIIYGNPLFKARHAAFIAKFFKSAHTD